MISFLCQGVPQYIENQLRILKDFFSNMGMTANTDKTKVMIIKTNKITYDTFIYNNKNLEELNSYKYLGIDIHHKLNWNYRIEKWIIGGSKSYYGLENNCNQLIFGVQIRRNSSLRVLLHLLLFMDVKSQALVSLVNLGER
jgi:hypothetical protein